MEIVKFYGKGQSTNRLIVQWNLGNICNYSCEYCPSILHRGDRPWVELPLIENTLLKIRDQFPHKKMFVEFLGGEITLYKDFINLMKFCKDQKINNMIFTNASRTFRHWQEVIPVLDEVLLTFHPHTSNQLHFENIIKLCVEHQCKVYVHIAMPGDVFWETATYGEYLKNTYPNLYISMVLMMDKEHRKNFNGFYYDYSESQIAFVSQFDRSTENYVAEYANGETELFNITDIKSKKLNQFSGFICGSTESIINIDYIGNATTSVCGQKPRINIYTDDVNKLFFKHICRKSFCDNPSDIRIIKVSGETQY